MVRETCRQSKLEKIKHQEGVQTGDLLTSDDPTHMRTHSFILPSWTKDYRHGSSKQIYEIKAAHAGLYSSSENHNLNGVQLMINHMKSGLLIEEPFLIEESFLREEPFLQPVSRASHFLPQKPSKATLFHSCVKPLVSFQMRKAKHPKLKLSKTLSFPTTIPVALPVGLPQEPTLEANMLAKIKQQLQQLRQSAVEVEADIQSVTKLIEVEQAEQACLREQQQSVHFKLKQMQYRVEKRKQEYQSLLSCAKQYSESNVADLRQEVGQLRQRCEQLRDRKKVIESSNLLWQDRKNTIMAKLCEIEAEIIRLGQNRDRSLKEIQAKIQEEEQLQEEHHKLELVLSNLCEFGCEDIPQQIAEIRQNKSLISVEVDCVTEGENCTEQMMEEQRRQLLVLQRDCEMLEMNRMQKKQMQRKLKKLLEQKAKRNCQAVSEISQVKKIVPTEQAKEQSIREEVRGLRQKRDQVYSIGKVQFKEQKISYEFEDYSDLGQEKSELDQLTLFLKNNGKEQSKGQWMKIMKQFVVGLCVTGALWLPWCWL